MYTVRLFRDPQPGETPKPNPSLMDLENGDGTDKIPVLDPNKPPPPAPGAPPAPVEGVNPDGTLQDGYEKDTEGKVQKKAAAPDPNKPSAIEGVNEDGSLQDGYEKAADGTVQKIAGEPESFWGEVEKITGIPIEVTYPAGVEPDTPEGAAAREMAVRDQAIQQYDLWLEKNRPRAYAYMLHTSAGRPDEEFFGDKRTAFTLPAMDALEQSPEVQETVYKTYLISKGVEEDEAAALAKAAITGNKLKEKAIAAHTAITKAQNDQLAALKDQESQMAIRTQQAETKLMSNIDSTMKDMGFIVPDAKKPEFRQFMIDNLQYYPEQGKFMIVQELNEASLKLQMESMFFQFFKGDLSTVVKKQANTQVTQKLRLSLDKAKETTNKDAGVGSSTKSKLTLGQV